ncbi:hypothetical protein DL93DRAFT_2070624 [Clavulina sp. PMI_390]|nr:hypothetical protein DL93DRAFT_2070624 [Clavulina sp. PMI_390]
MAKKTFRSVLEFNERQQRFPPTSLAAPVRIACGGDTGVFDHGKNAREMVCMVNLGVAPLTVLSWNVLNGWRCVRSLRMEQDIASSSSSSSAAVAEGRSPWHGESPRETEVLEMAYAQRFVNAVKVTGRKLTRAELGDNAVPFGAIRPGFAADIIALGGAAGDLEGSPEGFEHSVDGGNVQFVMKGGRVWKAGGVWSGSR